jgi:hypothetical protein
MARRSWFGRRNRGKWLEKSESNTVRTNEEEGSVGAARTRGYGRLPCRHCRSTGHLREYIPFKKKMMDNWCRLLRTISLKEGAVCFHKIYEPNFSTRNFRKQLNTIFSPMIQFRLAYICSQKMQLNLNELWLHGTEIFKSHSR